MFICYVVPRSGSGAQVDLIHLNTPSINSMFILDAVPRAESEAQNDLGFGPQIRRLPLVFTESTRTIEHLVPSIKSLCGNFG